MRPSVSSGTLDSLSKAARVGGVGVRRGGIPGGRELVCTRRTHGLCPKPRAKKGFVCPSGRKRHAWESTESLGRQKPPVPMHAAAHCLCENTGRPGWAWGSVGERIRGHGWLSPFAAHLRLSQHCLLTGSTLVQKKYLKKERKKKTHTHTGGGFLGGPVVKPSSYDAGS